MTRKTIRGVGLSPAISPSRIVSYGTRELHVVGQGGDDAAVRLLVQVKLCVRDARDVWWMADAVQVVRTGWLVQFYLSSVTDWAAHVNLN